jgi:hypothetical protein
VLCGRGERSSSPARPSWWCRRSHLCTVARPELLGVPRSVKRGHIMQDVVVMGVAAALGLGTASASVWIILGAIALAGAGGGIINALLSDNGDIEAYSREGVEV